MFRDKKPYSDGLYNYFGMFMSKLLFCAGELPHVLVQGERLFSLYDSYLEHCITLWALDDDAITPTWTLTFKLILNSAVYEDYPVTNGSIVLPSKVQLTITDNDGKINQTFAILYSIKIKISYSFQLLHVSQINIYSYIAKVSHC